MNDEKNKCMLRMELHRILQDSRNIVNLTMPADLIDRAKEAKLETEDEEVD